MLCFMIVGFCSNGDIFLISMHYTQLYKLLAQIALPAVIVYLVVVQWAL